MTNLTMLSSLMRSAQGKHIKVYDGVKCASIFNGSFSNNNAQGIAPLEQRLETSVATLSLPPPSEPSPAHQPQDGTPGKTIRRLSKAFAWIQSFHNYSKQRKRKSRFYGWKWGILMGAILATCVLALNIALLAIGIGKERDKGIVTVLSSDQRTVFRSNVGMHVLINVSSTLLLGASNYGMQVLCSPTRTQCDRAHRKGHTLDVGSPTSIANILNTPGRRRLLCIALAASSIPLHLLYNASIYQVVAAANEYTVRIVDSLASNWTIQLETATNGSTSQIMNVAELKKAYGVDRAESWWDLTLCVDEVIVTDTRYAGPRDGGYIECFNFTSNLTASCDPGVTLPAILRYVDETSDWTDGIEGDGWCGAERLQSAMKEHVLKPYRVYLHVQKGYARPRPQPSRISLSLPLIIIVIVCNAVKIAALLIILLDTSLEPPLVTIGDAICSFLTYSDPTTVKYRNYSRDDFVRMRGDAKARALLTSLPKPKPYDVSHRKPRVRRYASEVSRYRWEHKCTVIHISTCAVFLGLGSILVLGYARPGAWGTSSPDYYNFSNALDGFGAAALSVFVNSPQLMLSALFLITNAYCTKWATIREYNEFGTKPTTLRVSKPEGNQRGTYFLQLPLRWALPLNATGGILHWLLSQSIFLVRKEYLDADGKWDKTRSISAFGLSGTAVLVFLAVIVIFFVTIERIASKRFVEMVPYAGLYTWVISASCHPPFSETGPPLEEVSWGITQDGRFSFSSNAVIIHPQTEPSSGATAANWKERVAEIGRRIFGARRWMCSRQKQRQRADEEG